METFEGKANVKTVNGQAPDSGGNVNVKEYSHPDSGVTAGTYRKVTVNAQGHVIKGENPILAIAEGGTGADNTTSALSNLGILGAIVNASVSGKTITFTKKDNTKFSIDTQDTNNGIVAALLEQNGYVKFANGLIWQWGVADNGVVAQNWSKTITLPIAFSNSNYIVAGSVETIAGWYTLFAHSNKTTSSVLIFASGCWSGNTSRYANWFALGY